MIVCLEGRDGCGKTTQAKLLAERFGAKSMKYPDRSTPVGKLIYAHLEQKWSTYWRQDRDWSASATLDATVFQALHLMDQSDRAAELESAASLGDVVLDRYWPSGFAYGMAEGLDGAWVEELFRRLPQPDAFILLEVEPETARARFANKPQDRYEARSDFMLRVADNYKLLWGQRYHSLDPVWIRVDANGSTEEVAEALATWWTELRLGCERRPPSPERHL